MAKKKKTTRKKAQAKGDTDKARKDAIKDIDARLNGDATLSEKGGKATKTEKAPKEKKTRKLSGLDHAAQVLAASKEPLNAKTIAEREAWKIAESQERWRLVAINPTFVLGPSLSVRKDGTSVGFMIRMADGTMRFGVPDLHLGVVDVRDVALAHILAAAKPEAEGRHLLCADTSTLLEMGQSLRRRFGDRYRFPKSLAPKPLLYILGPLNGLSWHYIRNNVGIPLRFDNTKSRSALGVEYRSIDDTLADHLQQLEDVGLLAS